MPSFEFYNIAEITEITPHPQSSSLKLCKVLYKNNGSDEYLTVVCGASNAAVGLKTILARKGATTAQGLVIGSAVIRGVASEGMLCSPLEMGFSEEKGLIDLPPSVSLGDSVQSLLDKKIYLSSTPWHQFKLVEKLAEHKDFARTKKIVRLKAQEIVPNDYLLTSETYWDEKLQEYKYLHHKN
jgi:tRNA-binding EMAP/Myf-like protein